jgi:hypothetical protein
MGIEAEVMSWDDTRDSVHTTLLGTGRWTNGNGMTYRTLAEAMTAGRQLARLRRVEHVVHGRDGAIRNRYEPA